MSSRRATVRKPVLIALVLVVFIMVVGGGGLFLAERRGDTIDVRTDERNAAVGAAEQVIDCVKDPATSSTEACAAEAQQAQETLEEQVPPVSLTKTQRREVVLIASQLVATRPELSADDVADQVIALLPDVVDGEQGPRGRRGAAGEDGGTPSVAELRALVEAVYAANPPAPGTDGTDGAQGGKGDVGARGPDGPAGPQGPEGPAGADGAPGQAGADGRDGVDGADGAPGRGIASMSCDPDTQMFVAHYTDGTSQPIEGSDCVAGGVLRP